MEKIAKGVNNINFTMLYGNYCYIIIENFPQKFTLCIRPTKYRTAVFYRKHCVLAFMVLAVLGLPNVCDIEGSQNEYIFRHQLPVSTENSASFVLTAMRESTRFSWCSWVSS